MEIIYILRKKEGEGGKNYFKILRAKFSRGKVTA